MNVEEIWKIIWQYTQDKEEMVRNAAYKIVTSVKRIDNFMNIIEMF